LCIAQPISIQSKNRLSLRLAVAVNKSMFVTGSCHALGVVGR